MTLPNSDDGSASALSVGIRASRLTVVQLWLGALSSGGELRHADVAAITAGARSASRSEHDVIASVLNDYFIERGQPDRVALWSDLAATGPTEAA